MAEGGVFTGVNPLKDYMAVFLLQLIIIIGFTRGLARLFRSLRQPKVVWEIIGGIMLGPSLLSNIPYFKSAIFPKDSLSALNNISNVGLVLYLFLTGMEIDLKMMVANFRKSAIISIAGVAIPLGLGILSSAFLYDKIMDFTHLSEEEHAPPYTAFSMFIGVAMSITAFPVLATILIDQQLTKTKVGIITISAATVDDALAWTLMALAVSMLTAADNYFITLYVFATLVAWASFIVFVFRPMYAKYVAYMTKKHSRYNFLVATTFVFIFISAYVTQIIGVHAMFGGFLMGLAVPHDSDFAIKITEKIEDFNGSVWLPLYFAYSGLNTDLKTMDNGYAWGAFFLVLTIATVGKFGGCVLASKMQGNITWRESATIGILMNTKGLVEVIVLNLGLSEGVINVDIFTIMILMAITTTVATSPLLKVIYPKEMRVNVGQADHHHQKEGSKKQLSKKESEHKSIEHAGDVPVKVEQSTKHQALRKGTREFDVPEDLEPIRICTPFHNQEEALCLATFLSLFGSSSQELVIGAYHLLEISDNYLRDNMLSLMKDGDDVKEKDPTQFDSVLKMVSVFGELVSATEVKYGVTMGHQDDFANDIASFAYNMDAEMIVVPFHREPGSNNIAADYEEAEYIHYVLEVANLCKQHYALFLDKRHTAGAPPKASTRQRVAVVVQDTGSNAQLFKLVEHLLAKQYTDINVILFANELKDSQQTIREDDTLAEEPPEELIHRPTLSLQASELIQAARNAYKAHRSSINFHTMSSNNDFKEVRDFIVADADARPFDLVIVQSDAQLPIGFITFSSLLGGLGETLINDPKIDAPIMVIHAPPAEELGHVTASKANLLPSFLQTEHSKQVKVTGAKRDRKYSSSKTRSVHEMVMRQFEKKINPEDGKIDE